MARFRSGVNVILAPRLIAASPPDRPRSDNRAGLPIERMRAKADGDRCALFAKGDRGGYSFDRRVVMIFTPGGVPR